jgi:hypothetical protein
MLALSRFGKFHPASGLHDGCAVYCLVRQGRVMYVGQSSRIFARLQYWQAQGLPYDDARVMFVPRAELRETERRLIGFFSPPWNTAGITPGSGHKPEPSVNPEGTAVLAGLSAAPQSARIQRRF